MIFDLDLAGQQWQVDVPDEELSGFYRPLLAELRERWQRAGESRYIVLLAAPPGCGKTTLCAVLQALAAESPHGPQVAPLGMDAYHFPNRYLDAATIEADGRTWPLRQLKGCPESYDLASLRRDLEALRGGREVRWPRYDRALHEPVPGESPVPPQAICLIEGNYLLLDEPGWRELRDLADWTWFLDTDEAAILPDILRRHQRGGRSPEDARRHYDFCDHRNRERIYRHRLPADLQLRAGPDRRLSGNAN